MCRCPPSTLTFRTALRNVFILFYFIPLLLSSTFGNADSRNAQPSQNFEDGRLIVMWVRTTATRNARMNLRRTWLRTVPDG
jgi:hypothetical protein